MALRIAAVIAMAILSLAAVAVAACGGSSVSSPGASARPAATASGGTSSAATTMIPVAGTKTLVQGGGASAQTSAITLVYRSEMSDPRLSGVLTLKVQTLRRPDKSAELSGTSELRNAGGTWEGSWHGIIAKGGVYHYSYEEAKGTGAYAGLKCRGIGFCAARGAAVTAGVRVSWAGSIEAAGGGPVPAAGSTGQAPAGWTPVAGKTTYLKNGDVWWVFEVAASDARAGGTVMNDFHADPPRPDGSLDWWSRWSLRNDQGKWVDGHATGSRGFGGPEHFFHAAGKGAGAYAGLSYDLLLHFDEPEGGLTPDTPMYVAGWIRAVK